MNLMCMLGSWQMRTGWELAPELSERMEAAELDVLNGTRPMADMAKVREGGPHW